MNYHDKQSIYKISKLLIPIRGVKRENIKG